MGGAEALISAESIGNWFTNAIKNFFLWIWDSILGAAKSVYHGIANWATELAKDIFHSLSSATSVSQENANKMQDAYVFVVFGASGDLAEKKIYPMLWMLYKQKLLPDNTTIVGYARSDLTVDAIREKCKNWFKVR